MYINICIYYYVFCEWYGKKVFKVYLNIINVYLIFLYYMNYNVKMGENVWKYIDIIYYF